ncbi:MAG: PhoP family transcriptional regulator [Bacteroidetes bacterium]|jgi:DNA-binding response OmpR family regulator|nr:PhoP family transcriptional regulator [Bacteroidota bacterium]
MKTVLVIEDEDFISSLIARALKKEGYSVVVTSDFASSIKIIDSSAIDLVISDVMLPFTGGMEIVEHVKGNPRLQHIPIILVTGMDKDILYASKVKAEAILSKPFDMNQLVALVNANLSATAAE